MGGLMEGGIRKADSAGLGGLVRGGAAMVNIGSCFLEVFRISSADTALGNIEIPMMVNMGYDADFSGCYHHILC